MISSIRSFNQTDLNTVTEQWNMATSDSVSVERIDDPVVVVPCGHVYNSSTIEYIWNRAVNSGSEKNCPMCRGSIERYFKTSAVLKLIQEGDDLLQIIQQLFNKNQGSKEGDFPIMKIDSPFVTSCGHEIIEKSSESLKNKCIQCLSSQPANKPVKCVVKDLIDRRNQFVKIINELEDAPKIYEDVKEKIQDTPQEKWDFDTVPYPGGTCHLYVNRDWTPLEPVSMSVYEKAEAEKYPDIERRWSAKNVDGDHLFLAYVRVNGHKDGHIEIMLGSMLKEQFQAYLAKFGWKLDEQEEGRKDGRNNKMGIFMAKTPVQLAWALDFIGKNTINADQYGFLKQLVANSNNWRGVEEANDAFVKISFFEYSQKKIEEAATKKAIDQLNPTEFAIQRHGGQH